MGRYIGVLRISTLVLMLKIYEKLKNTIAERSFLTLTIHVDPNYQQWWIR